MIYTTNRPDVLDDAMNPRIIYQIEIGLTGPKKEQK